MAYQSMNQCQYLTITLLLYIVIVVLALVIDDLSTIFDLIGAFGFSFSAFILPALIYLIMTSESYSTQYELVGMSKSSIRWNRIGSCLLILLGLTNMCLVIVKTIDNNHEDE